METLKDNNAVQFNSNSNINININELLMDNKKLISFIGSRQSGTTFLINNVSLILARKNISVGILDLTSNKSLYYIFTKNKESIREEVKNTLKNLNDRNPKGIEVESNLTVYTDLPREKDENLKIEKILETLLKKHQIVIFDTDFTTDISYFKYSEQIYLVQTMDILTIRPLTEFLSKLKSQNAMNSEKLRIILNKFIELNDITIKDLIGGLAFYNDTSMAYMQQLFEKNGMKYTTIPFDQSAYEIYLQDVVKYNISIDKYNEEFRYYLERLANDIMLE